MLRRRPLARAAIRTTAVVGTAAVVSNHMAAKNQQAQAAQMAPPPAPAEMAPPPAPAAGLTPEAMEQLTQLAGLKDQGILSEEEFAAEKAKILGS
jgi:hypothetical protein